MYIAQTICGNEAQGLNSLCSTNHALIRQISDIHTLAALSTLIYATNHLISNKCGERVALIIELIKCVLPKYIEYVWTYEKSANDHPKAIGECGDS